VCELPPRLHAHICGQLTHLLQPCAHFVDCIFRPVGTNVARTFKKAWLFKIQT
jgi:hypothetical protein